MHDLDSYNKNPYHMNLNELLEIWKYEEDQPFIGWDFSHLDGRMLEGQFPWSYRLRAAELMRQSSSVVDLDTGGGEPFLKLYEYWPPKIVATEHYPPNFKLATERLSSFGARVVDVELSDFGPMPFADRVLAQTPKSTGKWEALTFVARKYLIEARKMESTVD